MSHTIGIFTPNIHFTAPLYSDYLTPTGAIGKGANAPDLEDFRDGIFMNAFAGAGPTTEQGFFTVHILHDILPNTSPTWHIHWAHNIDSGTYTADTAAVKWNVDCSTARGYGIEAFPSVTTVSTTQTAGAQYVHHITNDDDMVINDTIEPDTMMISRIYRDPADAADTFGYDAFLINVDLHYQIGQIGTPERNRPFSDF